MEGRSARAKQAAEPPDDPVDHDHQVVGPGGSFRRPFLGHRLPPVPSSQVTHSHDGLKGLLWEGSAEGELARGRGGGGRAHGKGDAVLIRGGAFGLANRDADAGGETKLTTGGRIRKRLFGGERIGVDVAVGSGWRVTADRWGLRLAEEEEEAICQLASSREGKGRPRKDEGSNHQPSEVL